MKVSALIKLLENCDPDLPIYVRHQNPNYDNGDYWELTHSDVQNDYVTDLENDVEIPAIIIGDNMI